MSVMPPNHCLQCNAADIVTPEQTGKLMKVVPETDGHRVELQWAVAPESKAYKTFPCSYVRCDAPGCMAPVLTADGVFHKSWLCTHVCVRVQCTNNYLPAVVCAVLLLSCS